MDINEIIKYVKDILMVKTNQKLTLKTKKIVQIMYDFYFKIQ